MHVCKLLHCILLTVRYIIYSMRTRHTTPFPLYMFPYFLHFNNEMSLCLSIINSHNLHSLYTFFSISIFLKISNLKVLILFSTLQYALIESKKMYVRYISHELRTPLNSAFLGNFFTFYYLLYCHFIYSILIHYSYCFS